MAAYNAGKKKCGEDVVILVRVGEKGYKAYYTDARKVRNAILDEVLLVAPSDLMDIRNEEKLPVQFGCDTLEAVIKWLIARGHRLAIVGGDQQAV